MSAHQPISAHQDHPAIGQGIARAVRTVLLGLLGLLLSSIWASEMGWGPGPADAPPSGWELRHAPDSPGTVRRHLDEITLDTPPGSFSHLDHPLAGMDGTDEAPLRAECGMSIDRGSAVESVPTILALYWSPTALVAIGLGDGGGDRAGRDWLNHVYTLTVAAKTDLGKADVGLYHGASRMHVRLVLTSKSISFYASGDGWNWARVGALARSGEFTAPPARLIVGRGWTADKDAKPFLDNNNAVKGPIASYHFSDLHVSTQPASVPSALMKDYEKKESREETVDAIVAAGMIKEWQVLGPLPPREQPYPIETLPPETALPGLVEKLPWVVFKPGESPTDRIIFLHNVVPGPAENAIRYAVAKISATEAHQERFFFDGFRTMTLFLNGSQLAQDHHDNASVGLDRLSAVGMLVPGENRLVMRLSAGGGGATLMTVRHEHGDPLYHIALIKRLAIDFPDEADANLQAQLDVARTWENLGYQHEAARALEEVAKLGDASPDQIDQAMIERTRLDRELGDDVKVLTDLDELTKRWADSSDVVGAHLKAAGMFERMGMRDKATAALAAAASAAGADPDRQIEIAIERARLHQASGDLAGVLADLMAGAHSLPAGDARRSEFLVQTAIRQHRVNADPAATIADALEHPSLVALRRIAALQALRKDVAGQHRTLSRLEPLDPSGLEAPAFALAELEAADGKPEQALASYRRGIARLPGGVAEPVMARLHALSGPKALDEARGAAVEAMLRSSPEGESLLAAIGHSGPPSLPAEPPIWWICGSFEDRPTFACYGDDFWSKKGVDIAHIDVKKPVEGKAWVSIGREAWPNGVIDLKGRFGTDNCCCLLYTEVASDRDLVTPLNMGADDGLRVWVNGKQIHNDQIQRGVSPDSITESATFHKGVNTILAMIQQGGGGWGFQLRIAGGSPTANVSEAVAAARDQSLPRAAQLSQLQGAADALIRAGNYPAASTLARTMLACYPDQAAMQFTIGWNFETQARVHGDGGLLMDLESFFESSPQALAPEWDGNMRDQRLRLASLMGDWCRFSGAQAVLEDIRHSVFDLGSQAESLHYLGDLYHRTGFQRLATAAYTKALAMGVGGGFDGAMQSLIWQARPPKNRSPSDVAFEVNNQLRTAERAAAAHDIDHAIVDLQKAIEEHGGQLCQAADGRLLSVSSYAALCLRGLGQPGAEAYRGHFESRAQQELVRAVATDDPDACERIASTYPLTEAASSALSHAARHYLDRGANQLAAATFERLLSTGFPLAAPARGELAAAWLHAAALANDRQALARASALLSSLTGPLVIAGAPADAHAIIAAEQARLTPAPPVAAPSAIGTPSLLASFPVPPDDLFDTQRIAWLSPAQIVVRPVVAGDQLMVTTLTGCRAIDLATGTTRWRDYPEFPAQRTAQRWPGFAGSPESQVAISGHLSIARVLRGGTGVIEARELANGHLCWSTEGTLAGWWCSSSPTAGEDRVFARFVVDGRTQLAALALDDGHLLWSTTLANRRSTMTNLGDADIPLDGFAPAPTLLGRQVLVATDLGSVMSVDAGNGAIEWVAAYGRGMIDPGIGSNALAILAMRTPPRVVVAGDHLLVAPRDSLTLISLNTNGSIAWRHDLDASRTIAAVTADGATAITEWLTVDAIDTRTGALRWRWMPRSDDGSPLGTATIAGDEVWVATGHALIRLALADGTERERRSWKELGVLGPVPGQLLMTSHGMIGVGNGSVVSFAGVKPTQPANALPGIEHDTPIEFAELPAAPAGSPMAVHWRMGGDPCYEIDQPDGTPPGMCFVRFRFSFALIDAAKHSIRWRIRMVPDLRWILYSKELVLVGHYGGITAYNRSDGMMRWNTDVSVTPVDALKENWVTPGGNVGDTTLTVFRPWNHPTVTVLSLEDGHALGAFNIDGGAPFVSVERGGTVYTASRTGEGVFIDVRPLTNLGARASKVDFGMAASDKDGAYTDAGGMVLHNAAKAVYFDLTSKTAHPFPYISSESYLWTEEGKTLFYGHDWADHWTSAVLDPATHKVLFSEVTMNGGGAFADKGRMAYHLLHDHLLREDWDRSGHDGILAKNPADGKEQWRVDGREQWALHYHGIAVLDQVAVALFSEIENRFSYETIDLTSGKVLTRGPLPGIPGDSLIPLVAVGGDILYGTTEGLVAMSPTTAAAAAGTSPQPSLPALPSLHSWRVYPAPGAISIDGRLDDWKGVPVHPITAPVAARSGGGSTPPPTSQAALRMCFDANFIYSAVAVTTDHHADLQPGGSLYLGDAVVMTIDVLGGQWHNSGTIAIGMALVDGRPLLTVNGSTVPATAHGPDQACMRAAVDGHGITYEVALPWAMLGRDAANRPGGHGDMTVGLLVVEQHGDESPRGLEIGWGLAEGVDRSLWQPVHLGTHADHSINGEAFTLYGGGHVAWGPAGVHRAATHEDQPWIVNDLPLGATPTADGGDAWTWVADNPPPGSPRAHVSGANDAMHQHYFSNAPLMELQEGDVFYAYVYLDPAHLPLEVMLQFNLNGSWEHRASWGQHKLGAGDSPSYHPMGDLPKPGTWVRLEVPIEAVGLQ